MIISGSTVATNTGRLIQIPYPPFMGEYVQLVLRGRGAAHLCGHPEFENVCRSCGEVEISIYEKECAGCKLRKYVTGPWVCGGFVGKALEDFKQEGDDFVGWVKCK